MKMTDKLFRAIMRNLHAYVLLINRDFTVFYTNYYDITGAVKPAETGRVGDILRCNNALSAAGGCGTHDLCEPRAECHRECLCGAKELHGFGSYSES